jgi:hypothetical protein
MKLGSAREHKGIAKRILDPAGAWISGSGAGSRAMEPGDTPSSIEIRYRH